MKFLDLFIVALMPVLKVLLVTAVGLFLAIDRIDLLGANARHHLNNLVFYVFSPSLIASNLADTITVESFSTLWFMPVNILLAFVIGSALGWILIKITRAPQHIRGLVIGCCSAGNIGNLLLIILPAICEETNSPFGDSSTCSTYGEAYASLSMAILAVYLWSYVYILMRISANNENKAIDTNGSTVVTSTFGETSDTFSEISTEALLPSKDCPSSENYSDQVESPHTRTEGKVPLLENIKQKLKMLRGQIKLKMVLAPSTIAAIVGFVIGMVSPIRKAMIGDDAPLRVIYTSSSLLGDAAIPSITLIVGANLLKGLKRSGVGPSIIVGIMIIRYIALPLLGVGIVKAARHFGLVGTDSLYLFTLMLQYTVPPAMNIGTISQLVKAGESECSIIMLWTYGVASFFLTLWSVLFMWMVT